MITKPEVRYAQSGDVSIAYTVTGGGDFDLVVVPGYISNLDLFWESPLAQTYERWGSFSRLILFDKRGTGISDPVDKPATLEQRMDDVRAVMDAAGSERAALLGVSEGGAMSLLFAATYPERVSALVLFGSMARTTEAPDYPYAAPRDALVESDAELAQYWGQGITAEIFVPSIADIPEMREFGAKLERQGASPGMRKKYYEMFLDVDVRHVLPLVHQPALVLHSHGDRVVNVRAGRYVAEHLPNAKFVELPGIDHSLLGNPAALDEVEEFLTGAKPAARVDRVLSTVMFTDLVSSTRRAAELGDDNWRRVLDNHERLVRAELGRHRGNEIKTTGDGFLATFDGPARAIDCGVAVTDSIRDLGVEARVGVHSGEIELRGTDIAGIAVHIASRVGSLAGASEVLVSETVKGLVAGSGIAFEERGEHELKGVPEKWRLFAVARS
ncbi:MAG TPA: adenylate/guanylate cyclase domain-containing protein [Actinomycetota bacterium]|nr:adenylate/guanylate cyclase domain-containing protein [Actinomycetota bacterium]